MTLASSCVRVRHNLQLHTQYKGFCVFNCWRRLHVKRACTRCSVCAREAAIDLREVLELVKNILVALRFLKQHVTCHV